MNQMRRFASWLRQLGVSCLSSIKAEAMRLHQNPKAYSLEKLSSLHTFILGELRKLITARNLKRVVRQGGIELLRAGGLTLLLYIFVHFNYPAFANFVRGFTPATQRDIYTISAALESYEDWLNQRNEGFRNAISRDQELFLDIVKTVLPTKWESGFYKLTDSEWRGALNNGGVVNIPVNYRAFKSSPRLYVILKNLNFGRQADRTSYIQTSHELCTVVRCVIHLRFIHPNRTRIARLESPPQVHWIATGEFPEDLPVGESNDRGQMNIEVDP